MSICMALSRLELGSLDMLQEAMELEKCQNQSLVPAPAPQPACTVAWRVVGEAASKDKVDRMERQEEEEEEWVGGSVRRRLCLG